MKATPKVRPWVEAEFQKLDAGAKGRDDITTLLASPEIKKLWTELGFRTLSPQYKAMSPVKLVHLGEAIVTARRSFRSDAKVPMTRRLPMAKRLIRATDELASAWRELKQLDAEGELPDHFLEAVGSAATHSEEQFSASVLGYEDGFGPEATMARRLWAISALQHGYAHLEFLLTALNAASMSWPRRPMLVPKPGDQNAERLHFFRKLAQLLRLQYGGKSMKLPAFEVMAALYGAGSLVPSNIKELPPATR